MNEKPISPLRQRMIEDMTVRNFVEKTRNDYIRQVRTFTAFLGRSPDQAIPEDLRRFQLHQTRAGVRPPSINGSVTIWMRSRCAAGIFHRNAVFSRRTSALLHLPICSPESEGTSESQLGTKKQLTQAVSYIRNHPRFTPAWKWYQALEG